MTPIRFTKKPPIDVDSNPAVVNSGGSVNLSKDSVTMKKAMKTRNIPFTNPASTSTLSYP